MGFDPKEPGAEVSTKQCSHGGVPLGDSLGQDRGQDPVEVGGQLRVRSFDGGYGRIVEDEEGTWLGGYDPSGSHPMPVERHLADDRARSR